VVDAQAEARKGRVELHLSLSREELIAPAMATLNEAGGRVLTLRRIEPTLEEAFVRLVGDAAEDEEDGEATSRATLAVAPINYLGEEDEEVHQ
jgi:ABC-2 type transport system ATP-binding protein